MISCIIPFYNGHATIGRLLAGIPESLPVILVDDLSDVPYKTNSRKNLTVLRMLDKGYFSGAVNAGIKACPDSDVLVLNQDVVLSGTAWLDCLLNDAEHGMIGERIKGQHPAWEHGYIHGTFMFLRRELINKVGLMNQVDYPLWGATCEYQIRASRAGFKIKPLASIPGFSHDRKGRFGSSIQQVLDKQPAKKGWFIRTPPMISVIIPCYNYGRYIPDLINSLIGGKTSLGNMPGQTFQSFEVIIVNDASTDDTAKYLEQAADGWKGIRVVNMLKNGGTARAINAGVKASYGEFITIIGADDMMESFRLEKLYRAARKNPHSFIYDNLACFVHGSRRPDIKVGVSPYDFERLLTKNHVHAGILLPRHAWDEIKGYPDNFGDGREDWAVNVALGIKGWCGVLIPEVGYLYRREQQNRSLRNATQGHHQKFLAKLVKTFPNIYAGERPMGCCGGARKRGNPVGNTQLRTAHYVAGRTENTVLIEYIGTSHGTQAFYGPKSGKVYEAGLTRPIIEVQERDLHSGRLSDPGLLDIRDEGKTLFRRIKAQAPLTPPPVPVALELPEPPEIDVEVVEDVPLPILEVAGALPTYLADVPGISEKTLEILADNGVITVDVLLKADVDELAAFTGLSKRSLHLAIAKVRSAK